MDNKTDEKKTVTPLYLTIKVAENDSPEAINQGFYHGPLMAELTEVVWKSLNEQLPAELDDMLIVPALYYSAQTVGLSGSLSLELRSIIESKANAGEMFNAKLPAPFAGYNQEGVFEAEMPSDLTIPVKPEVARASAGVGAGRNYTMLVYLYGSRGAMNKTDLSLIDSPAKGMSLPREAKGIIQKLTGLKGALSVSLKPFDVYMDNYIKSYGMDFIMPLHKSMRYAAEPEYPITMNNGAIVLYDGNTDAQMDIVVSTFSEYTKSGFCDKNKASFEYMKYLETLDSLAKALERIMGIIPCYRFADTYTLNECRDNVEDRQSLLKNLPRSEMPIDVEMINTEEDGDSFYYFENWTTDQSNRNHAQIYSKYRVTDEGMLVHVSNTYFYSDVEDYRAALIDLNSSSSTIYIVPGEGIYTDEDNVVGFSGDNKDLERAEIIYQPVNNGKSQASSNIYSLN